MTPKGGRNISNELQLEPGSNGAAAPRKWAGALWESWSCLYRCPRLLSKQYLKGLWVKFLNGYTARCTPLPPHIQAVSLCPCRGSPGHGLLCSQEQGHKLAEELTSAPRGTVLSSRPGSVSSSPSSVSLSPDLSKLPFFGSVT